MGKRRVAALEKIDADFKNLQEKIRRDPKGYEDEFERQFENYASQREIFLTAPNTASHEQSLSFHDLIDLISHVSDCYPRALQEFPEDLKAILAQNHENLHPDLREKLVGSLCLLRRKDIITSESLLTALFPILVSTPSKGLRKLLLQRILGDLRIANQKTKNHRLNRTIQTVLYNLVTSERTTSKPIYAISITREMWRRQLWVDARPVSVLRECCLSDNEKVIANGCKFFLGGDKEREEIEDESDSDEDTVDLKKLKHQNRTTKKSKKKARAYEKAVEKVKKAEKRKAKPSPLNFSALHLLHDPQGFAETLFSKHLQNTKSKLSLGTKLLVLQLVTRLVGLHKLTIMSLYSWFTKYLTPKQESVTSFLACLAQACHNQVPPDALEPLVLKISNEFISEGSAAEVAAAGLNSVREICTRQSLAMSDSLLQDLVLYRKSKDKGVMMAAKGLLSLYRVVGAELLNKRDRGKDATMGLKSGEVRQRKFGEEEEGGIEGIELLEQWKEEQKKRNRAEQGLPEVANDCEEDDEDNDDFNSSEWEVGSTESSDSGGWINVSDSEDDEPAAKRQKKETGTTPRDGDDDTNTEMEVQRISTLATTSILTPADLVKLQELRMEASVDKAMGNQKRRQNQLESQHVDDGLTAEQIAMPTALRKSTKEERIALAKEGKPDRDEHKSTQAIRKAKKEAEGKSTTNKEKAKKKNIFMTMGKAKGKQKRSLVQTRRVLRAHIERSKRGGRRGNSH